MRKLRTFIPPLLIMLLFAIQANVYGQVKILIKGKVTDAETGQPIPYIAISVQDGFVGTNTDLNGNYRLEVGKRVDTLVANFLGYLTVKRPVGKGSEQTIDFTMKRDSKLIDTVTVDAGYNPADLLLKRIIRNKDKNNYQSLPTASYELYTKYEIDLADFNAKTIDKNKLLSKFPHLKNYLDTTTESGTSILPALLIEHSSMVYEQRDPVKLHEIIKGSKIAFFDKEEFIDRLLSDVHQHLNIYENLMGVLGKSLISPIADYGLSVYKYNLNIYDTLYIGGEPHLEMTFKPKHKDDYAFKGKMVVNLRTYGIRSIEMTLNEEVNIGFIKELVYKAEFDKLKYQVNLDSSAVAWIPKKESVKMKFNYSIGGTAKIIGRETKTYGKFTVNQTLPPNAFDRNEITTIEDSASKRNQAFWDTARLDTLDKSQKGIYGMIDSLKRTTRFKVIKYTLQTLATAYAPAGPVEFGHIANIISSNPVERIRLRLGVRTNRNFSERVQLESYGAYGFKDNRFKYGGKVLFIAAKKPWNKITLTARTDVDFKSKHAEEFDQDNIFTLINKTSTTQRFYNIEEFKLDYETEISRDLMGYLTISHNSVAPYFAFNFDQNGRNNVSYITSEYTVGFRYQYKTTTLPGIFNRETQATKFFNMFRRKNEWPIFKLYFTQGFAGVLKSNFNYQELSIGMQGDYQLTAKMSMYYNLTLGKVFGTLPWLLLKIPEGNFAFIYNKYYFNNMNMLEFASDQYLSFNYQWHFGGLLFDKIPGIRKLKLREVITANVFWGSMTDANKRYNAQNSFLVASPIPYAEAGVGIENILKVLRLDSIWRLSYRNTVHNNKAVLNWALYASLFIKI